MFNEGKTPSQQLSIPRITRLAYAAPMVPALILSGQMYVLPGIYGQYYGLSLATISLVVFMAGLFDTLTDPMMGYWSDLYRARTGSRRLFVVCGMVLLLPCSWLLFDPWLDANGNAGLAGFVLCYFAFYWATTCTMIPHFAWAKDLSTSSDERTRLFGARNAGGLLGNGIGLVIPILPFFATSDITPETLRFSVWVVCLLMVPCLFLFNRYVPDGLRVHEVESTAENPFRALKALLQNRPYLLYLTAKIFYGLGVGGFYGLLFIFISSFLGLGEYYVYLFLLHIVVGFLLVSPTVHLANAFGKQRTFAIGIGLKIIAFLLLIYLLYSSGEQALLILCIAVILLAGTSMCCNIAGASYLADIVDYDTLKTGRDRTATFYSMQNFIEKVGTTSFGPALGLGLVGLFGFEPASPVQTEETQFGFALAMGWIPILVSLIAVWLFWLIPIDNRRRTIIRKRLDAREARNYKKSAVITSQSQQLSPSKQKLKKVIIDPT